MPEFVAKESLIGSVSANFNILCCNSDHLGKAAFYGQGAGSLPTGQAIVQDLLDLKDNVDTCNDHKTERGIIADDYRGRYYIRHKDTESLKEIIDEKINDDSFISKAISTKELKKILGEHNDEKMFIGEVRDD